MFDFSLPLVASRPQPPAQLPRRPVVPLGAPHAPPPRHHPPQLRGHGPAGGGLPAGQAGTRPGQVRAQGIMERFSVSRKCSMLWCNLVSKYMLFKFSAMEESNPTSPPPQPHDRDGGALRAGPLRGAPRVPRGPALHAVRAPRQGRRTALGHPGGGGVRG